MNIFNKLIKPFICNSTYTTQYNYILQHQPSTLPKAIYQYINGGHLRKFHFYVFLPSSYFIFLIIAQNYGLKCIKNTKTFEVILLNLKVLLTGLNIIIVWGSWACRWFDTILELYSKLYELYSAYHFLYRQPQHLHISLTESCLFANRMHDTQNE